MFQDQQFRGKLNLLTFQEQLMNVHFPVRHVWQAYVKIIWNVNVIYATRSWRHNPRHLLWLEIVEEQFHHDTVISCLNEHAIYCCCPAWCQALTRYQYLLRFLFVSVYFQYLCSYFEHFILNLRLFNCYVRNTDETIECINSNFLFTLSWHCYILTWFVHLKLFLQSFAFCWIDKKSREK